MRKYIFSLLAILLLISATAEAQMAPTPKSSPRTPVQKESIPGKTTSAPPRNVEGQLTVLEIEKLKIGDVNMRLFGIVPPQLSANYGPQARAALDTLTANQNVNCQIRDRDQGGRFLATCRVGNTDLALELLRRGLAVTARGSLSATDLLSSYMAAEQTAQAQKQGLWSVVTPPAAALPVAPAKAEVAVVPPSVPLAVPADKTVTVEKAPVNLPDEVQDKVSSAAIDASELTPLENNSLMATGTDIFSRYQILIAVFLMLTTAIGIFGIIATQRRLERRDEMKAIAAALRGELMAARGVCQARLKTLRTEEDDKAMVWPRIRATLYQAYVGRLGWLGAELARQIASIYGQASDYATYYNAGEEVRTEVTPKRQALQTLTNYIEEVLPKLAVIEQTGKLGSMTNASLKAQANVAAASKAGLPVAFWTALQNFARERFTEKAPIVMEDQKETLEEGMVDYAALIEAEMENLAFNETGSDPEKTPDNVMKIRGSGV